MFMSRRMSRGFAMVRVGRNVIEASRINLSQNLGEQARVTSLELFCGHNTEALEAKPPRWRSLRVASVQAKTQIVPKVWTGSGRSRHSTALTTGYLYKGSTLSRLLWRRKRVVLSTALPTAVKPGMIQSILLILAFQLKPRYQTTHGRSFNV